MSLGSQLRRLNEKAAAFRQVLFGTNADETPVTVEYNRGEHKDIQAYYSPIRRRIRTNEAGVSVVLGGTVRWSKTAYPFVPEQNKQLLIRETAGSEVKEINLVINEIGGGHPASAEWVLTCSAF